MKPSLLNMPAAALVKSELITTLRRTRSFFILAAFVGAGICVVVVDWPEHVPMNMMARRARELFAAVSVFLVCGSALFIPALASAAIVIEKERHTFDMLTLTLIRPTAMLVAKLINSLGFYALLVIACMPVLGVCFFLVGLDWTQVIPTFILILLTAVSLAMVGVLSSALFRNSFFAIIGAYIGMLALMAGPMFVIMLLMFLSDSVGNPARELYEVASHFSPVVTVWDTSRELGQFVVAVVYQLIFIGVCWFLTRSILRRPPRPVIVHTEKPIDDPVTLRERRRTFPFYLIDPLQRKEPIKDGRNPMLAKELYWGVTNRGATLIRVFYTALGIYFIGGAMVIYLEGTFDTIFLWLVSQIVLTVMATPALVANTLTKEYELGNMDMLRSTLLTPRQIVVGKFYSGAATIVPLVLAAICSCISLIVMYDVRWDLLVTGYGTLIVCSFMSLGVGLFASMLTRRTATALVLTYIFSILVFLGIYVIAGIVLVWMDVVTSVSLYPSPPIICLISPIIAFVYNVGMSRTSTLVNSYWLFAMAAHTLVAWAFIMISLAGFTRYRMRDR